MDSTKALEKYSSIAIQLVEVLNKDFFTGSKTIEPTFISECKQRKLLQLSVEVDDIQYYAAFFIQYGLTDILRRSILFYENNAFVAFDHKTNVFLVSEENKSWLDELVKNISATPYNAEEEEKFISSMLVQKDQSIF